jgi:hypothetical protein
MLMQALGVWVIPGIKLEKPLYFLSYKLSVTQTRWSTTEKEAFTKHYALQKLDHYLHGAQFTIMTDHKPLKYILQSPMQNKRVQNWALCISGYNCCVRYIPGVENTCADLLSCLPRVEEDGEASDQSTTKSLLQWIGPWKLTP